MKTPRGEAMSVSDAKAVTEQIPEKEYRILEELGEDWNCSPLEALKKVLGLYEIPELYSAP